MHVATVGIIFMFALYSGTNSNIILPRNPPSPFKYALMARYIMHSSDWASIATISSQETIKGYPFVTLKSLSDGTKRNSTGVPYLYMTELDLSGKDIEVDNRVTIMVTLASSDYCETENFDPQDPRCAKVLVTGTVNKVKKSSPEDKFGLNSLFERHPSMKDWPARHNFYVAKVTIKQILVLDYFGGLKSVTVEDYFNANMTYIINNDMAFGEVSILEIKT